MGEGWAEDYSLGTGFPPQARGSEQGTRGGELEGSVPRSAARRWGGISGEGIDLARSDAAQVRGKNMAWVGRQAIRIGLAGSPGVA